MRFAPFLGAHTSSGFRWRYWVAMAPGLGLTAWLLLSAIELAEHNDDRAREIVRHEAMDLRGRIRDRIDTHILAMGRLAVHTVPEGVVRTNDTSNASTSWETEATLLIADYPELRALALMDSQYRVRGVVPAAHGESIAGIDLRKLDWSFYAALDFARFRRDSAMTGVHQMSEGEGRFLMAQPIFDGSEFQGFILGFFDCRDLLSPVLAPRAAEGFLSEVHDGSARLLGQFGSAGSDAGKWAWEQSLDLPLSDWRIQVWPTQELIGAQRSSLPQLALALGLTSALLLSLTMHRLQVTRVPESAAADDARGPAASSVGTRAGWPAGHRIVSGGGASAAASAGSESEVAADPADHTALEQPVLLREDGSLLTSLRSVAADMDPIGPEGGEVDAGADGESSPIEADDGCEDGEALQSDLPETSEERSESEVAASRPRLIANPAGQTPTGF